MRVTSTRLEATGDDLSIRNRRNTHATILVLKLALTIAALFARPPGGEPPAETPTGQRPGGGGVDLPKDRGGGGRGGGGVG